MRPTDRASFQKFILRRLGAPAFKINLSEEQVDDVIDMALYYFAQYHMDGSEKTYYKHILLQSEIDAGYITLPDNIIGAVRMFPTGFAISTDALFNMRYQFVMNDLYSLTNVSLVPYYMTMSHISLLEEILVGQQPIRFNRHNHLLYFDADKSTMAAGQYLIVEAHMVVDPVQFADVWNDKYLQEYTTALMKKQWGENISRFTTVLPSGIKLNGREIYEDACKEVARLEKEMISTFSIPSALFTA